MLDAAGSSSDVELVALLSTCESVVRRLDRATVDAVAALDRRGVFAEHGYRSATAALSDLLGWERFEARRRVTAAEQVTPRTGLDGAVLPARLAATAEVFAAGRTGLRHVEVIARVLASRPAGRLSPDVWAGAEAQLAGKADQYTPHELQQWGTALVELLDQDGEQPDDRPPARVNELFLTRLPDGGGKVKGRFDDAAMFDAIAAVIDAHATPLTAEDDRSAGERQAEALADVCGYVLDHAPSSVLPDAGGHRPHVNVLIRLDDLENRARAGCLDFGGPIAAGVAAHAVLRRRGGAGRAERQGPAARRRPGHPHHPGRATAGGGRPGPRVRPPRLRPATVLVRGASYCGVGARRRDETVEPGDVMQGSSPAGPFHGMGGADPRRAAGVHSAEVAGFRAETTPTSPAAPRRGASERTPNYTLTSPSYAARAARRGRGTGVAAGREPLVGDDLLVDRPALRGRRVSRRPFGGPGRPGDGSPRCHRTARRCRSRAPWPADRRSHRRSAAAARPPRPGRPRRS